MNRPNPFNYNSNAIMIYVSDLERYCNEIEKALSDSYLIDVLNRLDKTEKALDKACEKLAFASDERVIEELGSFMLGELNRTAKEWREWALKDEHI